MMLSEPFVLLLRPEVRFWPLDSHDAFRKRITIEILKPLIGHHAARGAQSCFDKSHLFTLLY